MNQLNNRIKLKGGSLSGVYLVNNEKFKFVRKEVSLVKNREYGFQRWYSQLKKIQRFNNLFPDLFPELLTYGIEGDIAYFDMQYLDNAISAHQFICNTTDVKKIEMFFEKLIYSMNQIHSLKFKSNESSLDLYIREEVTQKLNDVYNDSIFCNFLKYDHLIVNDIEIKPFCHDIGRYKDLFKKVYKNPFECFTHGNITLENLLYNEFENKLYFIDPYEENIIDSPLTEYSQIFQSSNSKYEIYNDLDIKIENNIINIENQSNFGLDYFNGLFKKHLVDELTTEQYISVNLFEVSQFIRMLPFKKEIDKNKMLLFYVVASKLFNNIKISTNYTRLILI